MWTVEQLVTELVKIMGCQQCVDEDTPHTEHYGIRGGRSLTAMEGKK